MSIYADKKAGKLTGWFRVEVQGKGQRFRARCRSHQEALEREVHFKECVVGGVAPRCPTPRKVAAKALVSPVTQLRPDFAGATLSKLRREADGRVWRGQASEAQNIAKLRIIEAVMGNTELDNINDRWIEDLKSELTRQRGMTDHTVNRYLACLSKALKWAVKMDYRTVKEVPPMEFYREDSGRIRVLSLAEEATAYKLLKPKFAALVRIAIPTGMRRGELLTVETGQIRPGWVDLWKTKGGSPRAIPLMPADEADLRWLADDRMPTAQQLRTAWLHLRTQMGMQEDEDFVFHCTRHTFATRAAERGVLPQVLQELMGHKTFAMTQRYTHMSDELKQASLAKMFAQ